MSTGGNGQSYEVRLSQATRVRIKQLHLQAAQQGKGTEFIRAFREIIDRLRWDPHTFGEPLYHLPALRLQIRQGVIQPLSVDYGVHEQKPLVFIRGVKVLS